MLEPEAVLSFELTCLELLVGGIARCAVVYRIR